MRLFYRIHACVLHYYIIFIKNKKGYRTIYTLLSSPSTEREVGHGGRGPMFTEAKEAEIINMVLANNAFNSKPHCEGRYRFLATLFKFLVHTTLG